MTAPLPRDVPITQELVRSSKPANNHAPPVNQDRYFHILVVRSENGMRYQCGELAAFFFNSAIELGRDGIPI